MEHVIYAATVFERGGRPGPNDLLRRDVEPVEVPKQLVIVVEDQKPCRKDQNCDEDEDGILMPLISHPTLHPHRIDLQEQEESSRPRDWALLPK